MFHRAASVVLLAALALGWAWPVHARQDPIFPTAGRFVLSTAVGSKLLAQCSRSAPSGKTEFREPSASAITELEKALPRFLVTQKQRGVRIPPLSQSYNRQYVGFAKGGVRFIYGNF